MIFLGLQEIVQGSKGCVLTDLQQFILVFNKGKLEINIQLTLVITKAKGGRNDFNFSKPMSARFCASKNEESR